MGAPKIRQRRAEAHRIVRNTLDRLRSHSAPCVTVIQDERTKAVLGVLIDRNTYPAWQAKNLEASAHAELIDFPLSI